MSSSAATSERDVRALDSEVMDLRFAVMLLLEIEAAYFSDVDDQAHDYLRAACSGVSRRFQTLDDKVFGDQSLEAIRAKRERVPAAPAPAVSPPATDLPATTVDPQSEGASQSPYAARLKPIDLESHLVSLRAATDLVAICDEHQEHEALSGAVNVLYDAVIRLESEIMGPDFVERRRARTIKASNATLDAASRKCGSS